ncbi:MAG: hypothetical protein WCW25_01110 [Patescibacteria group bacterium]
MSKKKLIIIFLITTVLTMGGFFLFRKKISKKCVNLKGDNQAICIKEEAVNSGNLKMCGQIFNNNLKYWCYYEIADKNNDHKICKNLSESDNCYLKIAINLKDEKICEKIFQKDIKAYCIINADPECLPSKFYTIDNEGKFNCADSKIKKECEVNVNCQWSYYENNTGSSDCTCCPKDPNKQPDRCLEKGE